LKESAEMPNGAFGTASATLYRELYLDANDVASWRLWRAPEQEGNAFTIERTGVFRNRRGQTRRIFMAVLVAALTQALFFALSTLASRMSGAVVLLYLLPLAIVAGAGVLITRPALLFSPPEAR
jgi:hypothetical protein